MVEPRPFFDEYGYWIERFLFPAAEVESLRDHYMELRKEPRWGDFSGVEPSADDPLKRYPRMIHMHRWDEASLRWACDERLNRTITRLLGQEPFMVQTMLYFKPAGARGQALHQDQFYLRAQPGTCCAAWLALDDCDEENGCLMVAPGSHKLPLLCTVGADTSQSFTDVAVPVPEDLPVVPCEMQAGDVLFFHGNLIHGSYPNRSADRFRRSLIGHYITGDAERVNAFYHPIHRMDGSIVEMGLSEQGGRCGTWVERDGTTVVELVDPESLQAPTDDQLLRQ